MNHHTEELEKNEILEWADKKFGKLKPHLKTIGLGLMALLVAIFGFLFVRNMQSNTYAQQWQSLYLATTNLWRTSSTESLNNIAEIEPDSVAGVWAMQLAGDAQMSQGLAKLVTDRNAALKNFGNARNLYQKINDSKAKKSPMLLQRSLFGLAYACESLGEFDAAKDHYMKLVESVSDSPFANQANRALDRLANPEIREVWEQFKTTGVAPASGLGENPDDISFPESGLGAGESGNTLEVPMKTPESTPPATKDGEGDQKPTSTGDEPKAESTPKAETEVPTETPTESNGGQ